jgi:hypothetical protein
VKGYRSKKKPQEGFMCNGVFGGVWSSLSIIDHKIRAHAKLQCKCLELQLWMFGYGSNFGPSSKTITSQEYCGVWPWGKFEQFQHQIATAQFGGGSFDPRFKDTPTIQKTTKCLVMRVSLAFKRHGGDH